VAIIGPSGCGKSTLLNIIGLLDNPTDGSLIFLGQEISNFSENKRADLRNEHIGFVFQSFNLIDELTVLILHGLSGDRPRLKMIWVLLQVAHFSSSLS